jgi:hypothetical protein
MALVKRRYTTVKGGEDWIVSVSWDDKSLEKAHWFEASVSATSEKTGAEFPFPKEIATYRIGEIEHSFREYVRLDFDGDTEAALKHLTDVIYRRIYSYIERGH